MNAPSVPPDDVSLPATGEGKAPLSAFQTMLRFILALIIGTAGAQAFIYFRLPLPWMLGSMLACAICAMSRLPIIGIEVLRKYTVSVIGVIVGSNFSPDLISQFSRWIPTLIGMIVYAIIYGLIHVPYFRYVCRFDRVTAYCAGMAGGLPEMIALGAERGADVRLIAMTHAARLFLVVLILPSVIQILWSVDLTSTGGLRPSGLTTALPDAGWFIACYVAGLVIAHYVDVPAKHLLVPLALSAVVHLAGLSSFQAPTEIVVGAQLILGTLVGCSFVGIAASYILRIMLLTLPPTLALILIAFAAAWGMAELTGFDNLAILLSYAPGGLNEMSLIAIAVHAEVAFVAVHHVFRITLIVLTATYLMGMMSRKDG